MLTIPLRELVEERVRDQQTGEKRVVARPARYPSANHAGADGRRGGRKTVDARALGADVEDTGRRAVEAGWECVTIVGGCRASVTYYVPDDRVADGWNVGQVEANALTRAGVWTDDSVARDVVLSVQPRAGGTERVVIVVQRVAAPAGARERAPRPQRRAAGKRVENGQIAPGQGAAASSSTFTKSAEKGRNGNKFTNPDQVQRRVRSIAELRSGDRLTFAERDALLGSEGIAPKPVPRS
ncbi:MAG: hypothetical protein ABSD03_15790 [Vulcanimicrobiaceae bacterium]